MNLYNPDDLPQNRIGMTVREEIASRVLAGLCVPCIAGGHNSNDDSEVRFKVGMAIRLTDALIEELERTKK